MENKFTRQYPRFGLYGDPQAFGEGFRGAMQDLSSEYLPISSPFQQLLQRGFAGHARQLAGDVPVKEFYQEPANIRKLLNTPVNLQKYALGLLGEVRLPNDQPLPKEFSQAIAGGLEIPEFLERQISYADMNIADIETAGSIRNIYDVQSALMRAQIPGMQGMAKSGEMQTMTSSGLDDISEQALGMINALYKYKPRAEGGSAGGTPYMLRSGYAAARASYDRGLQQGAVEYTVRALGTDAPNLKGLPKNFGVPMPGEEQGHLSDLLPQAPVLPEPGRFPMASEFGSAAVGAGIVDKVPWYQKLNIPSSGLPIGLRSREATGVFQFGGGPAVSPFGERGLREVVTPQVGSHTRAITSVINPSKVIDRVFDAPQITVPKGYNKLPQVILRQEDMPGLIPLIQQYEGGDTGLRSNPQFRLYYNSLKSLTPGGSRREPRAEYGIDFVNQGTRSNDLGPDEFDPALWNQAELPEEAWNELQSDEINPQNYPGGYYTNWQGEQHQRKGYLARNLGEGLSYSMREGEQDWAYYETIAARTGQTVQEVMASYGEPGRKPGAPEGIDASIEVGIKPYERVSAGERKLGPSVGTGLTVSEIAGEVAPGFHKAQRYRSYSHSQYERVSAQDVMGSEAEANYIDVEREAAYNELTPDVFAARLGFAYGQGGLKGVTHRGLASQKERRVIKKVGAVINKIEGVAPTPETQLPATTPNIPVEWARNIDRAARSVISGSLTASPHGQFVPSSKQVQQWHDKIDELGQRKGYDINAIPYIPGLGLTSKGQVKLTASSTFMPSPLIERETVARLPEELDEATLTARSLKKQVDFQKRVVAERAPTQEKLDYLNRIMGPEHSVTQAYSRALNPQREEMIPGTQKYSAVSMQPRRGRDEFEWETEGTLAGRLDVPYASGARGVVVGPGAGGPNDFSIRRTPEEVAALQRQNIESAVAKVNRFGTVYGTTEIDPGQTEQYRTIAQEMGYEMTVKREGSGEFSGGMGRRAGATSMVGFSPLGTP